MSCFSACTAVTTTAVYSWTLVSEFFFFLHVDGGMDGWICREVQCFVTLVFEARNDGFVQAPHHFGRRYRVSRVVENGMGTAVSSPRFCWKEIVSRLENGMGTYEKGYTKVAWRGVWGGGGAP